MELLRIHHEHFFSRELRVDGRKFNESRDVLINLNSISSADSSTTVKLGSTTVMCGIKVTIKEDIKSLETVNYGDLIDLKVSLHPLDEEGERDEISGLLMKTIKGNILFDHKPLISEDEDGETQYLTLNIEMVCLNNDGNVFDAFIIAFLAALNSLEFPGYKDICNQPIDPRSSGLEVIKKHRLPLIRFPISISSVLLKDDSILVDPNRDEEQLATGSIIAVFDVKSGQVIGLEKRGGTPIDANKCVKHLTFSKSLADTFFKTLPFLPSDEAMET